MARKTYDPDSRKIVKGGNLGLLRTPLDMGNLHPDNPMVDPAFPPGGRPLRGMFDYAIGRKANGGSKGTGARKK